MTGLNSYAAYYFEVRPWMAGGAGAASNTARGTTPRVGSDGVPVLYPGQIVKGGMAWRVGQSVFDVPVGMRLVLYTGGYESGTFTMHLVDVESNSAMTIDSDAGAYLGRRITPSGGSQAATAQTRDVGALFDQILASIRVGPHLPRGK